MTANTLKPVTCTCEKCRRMCAASVCVPTPDEARTLIRRGYASRMSLYQPNGNSPVNAFVAPSPTDPKARVLPNTNQGACTFFKEEKCQLHDIGLKPLEGRLAHHDRDWREIRVHVVSHWKGRQYESVGRQLEAAQARVKT